MHQCVRLAWAETMTHAYYLAHTLTCRFFLYIHYSRISHKDKLSEAATNYHFSLQVCLRVCVSECVFPDKWERGVWSLSRGLQASQIGLYPDCCLTWVDGITGGGCLSCHPPPHPSMGGGDTRWGSLRVYVSIRPLQADADTHIFRFKLWITYI